jgi:hypothetical protein
MTQASLDWATFDTVAEALALQGFNVIPLPPGAKGAAGSGVLFRHLNKPDSRRVTPDDRALWARIFRRKGFTGSVGAYILPASGHHWVYVIVDVDDPAFDAVAVETFGDSPLYVSRNGRIRHRYFRMKVGNPRAGHLMGAFGKSTVDVITTTGVVLPGSIHADGHVYDLSIPIETWTLEWATANVPLINLEAIADLRTQRRGALKADLHTAKPIEGNAAGFIHVRDPLDFGDSVWCGHVLPSTMIQTPDGPQPLHALPSGAKCFATYRDDRRPSSHVSDYRGTRYFWDMSAEPKRYWTMIEALDGATDPELQVNGGDYHAALEQALRTRLGVEVELVNDQGWLSDQLPLIENDETCFLIAPHGSGKTVLARREHDRASTSISVCNTQALTIANAAVLGLKAVYEGVDTEPKGSACIPSLHRYETPPEFFHVDEADAVHGFLHSGKVDDPLTAWRTLAYFAALSKRSLIASADLSFEDVALLTHAIRERNATRRIRVVIRVPARSRCRLSIRPVSVAKEAIHAHAIEDHDAPAFIGITTRKLAGQIAQGYRVANDLPVIDLDEVATMMDVVDTPQPYPLATVREEIDGLETSISSPFFVSGENNRHHAAIRWLEDTDALVDAHDLIVTSPAVQSGVSLDRPISAVFLIHENRDVPADAVLQIARRARNPESPEIIVGVRRWKPQPHRTDRPFLDDLVAKRARTTIKAIVGSFPDFAEDHAAEVDSEFAWSWRITSRKTIRSYSDPIGELVRAAKRHGWETHVDLEDDGDGSAFNTIVQAARGERTRINAEQTSEAERVEADERERLERAPKLMDGERQKLDRATISDFYAHPVTPDLVVLDNGGKYRAKVRAYTHAKLVAEGFEDVVAYRDHTHAKGKQPTELHHTLARAMLLVDLIANTIGALENGEHVAADLRAPVRAWWKANRSAAQTFFPRLKGPASDFEVRWLCDRLRGLGAVIATTGKNSNRRKIINFDRVDTHAEAYASRLFETFDQAETEKWRKQWRRKMG